MRRVVGRQQLSVVVRRCVHQCARAAHYTTATATTGVSPTLRGATSRRRQAHAHAVTTPRGTQVRHVSIQGDQSSLFPDVTISQAISSAAEELKRAGNVQQPHEEAVALMAAAMGTTREALFLRHDWYVDREVLRRFDFWVLRRVEGEPIAYVTGRREFYGRLFRVTPSVLIPRADSEAIITSVFSHISERRSEKRVLDLGTGSGCLLFTLLLEYPQWTGVGVDINTRNRYCWRANRLHYGLHDRADMYKDQWGNWDWKHGRFDVVVCNPPYLTRAQAQEARRGLRRPEPLLALNGGDDGFDEYRMLSRWVHLTLVCGGLFCVEVGQHQGDTVRALFACNPFLRYEGSSRDLRGVERVLSYRCLSSDGKSMTGEAPNVALTAHTRSGLYHSTNLQDKVMRKRDREERRAAEAAKLLNDDGEGEDCDDNDDDHDDDIALIGLQADRVGADVTTVRGVDVNVGGEVKTGSVKKKTTPVKKSKKKSTTSTKAKAKAKAKKTTATATTPTKAKKTAATATTPTKAKKTVKKEEKKATTTAKAKAKKDVGDTQASASTEATAKASQTTTTKATTTAKKKTRSTTRKKKTTTASTTPKKKKKTTTRVASSVKSSDDEGTKE